MRTTILFISLLLGSLSWAQNGKVNYSLLDKSQMQTDLLLTDVRPFTQLLDANRNNFNSYGLLATYKDLANSDEMNRFNKVELLESSIKQIVFEEPVYIGLIHSEYEFVDRSAYDNGWVTIENNKLKTVGNHPIFTKTTQTIIAPFAQRKKGLETIFKFNSNFFVNTTDNEIQKIDVDFGDGNGYTTLTTISEKTVKYNQAGRKTLTFRIHFTNGDVVTRISSLSVEYSNKDLNDVFGWSIETATSTHLADLSIYGETDLAPGVLDYEVFLSPDQILDKPIFVVDGFDPSDTRGIEAVYNMLSYTDNNNVEQNLADYVREEEGFDVVVVNFPTYTNENGNLVDGGADYIERNALSLVTLIETINAQKVGSEKNVLIGPSMGGLITRYALKYMENNNLDHDSRLWISVDSPHNGANVAMSVQYLVNYLGYGYPDIDEIKTVVQGMLRSKAAMQMLVDHLDGHGPGLPNTPRGAPIYFDAFQNRMANTGYPEETRNISITNGSGTGQIFPDLNDSPVYPGYNIVDGEIDAGQILGLNTRLKLKAKFMPYANQNVEIISAKAQAQIITWISVDEYSAYGAQTSASDGIDSSPGGLFDLLGLLDDFEIDPEYADLLQNALAVINVGVFNFIPTTSAMALFNQPNYYYEFNLGEGDKPWDSVINTHPETPFVNWFLADENEGHVKLTQGNIDFVLCELIEPEYKVKAISAVNVMICEGQTFNSKVYFEIKKGCFAESILSVEGLPTGATASMNYDTITENTLVTIHCEEFPVGENSFFIVPDGKMDKAVEFIVNVTPNIADLNGFTAYSLDDGQTFNNAIDSVIVAPNSNVVLKMDDTVFEGTAEWFDPQNNARGNMPSIENIQYESPENGTWRVELDFASNCNLLNKPSTLFFELIVGNPLSINDNTFDELVISPNPSNGKFLFEKLPSNESVNLKVYDNLGNIVTEKSNITNGSFLLDLNNFASGAYFISLQSSNNISYRKLIKE